MTEETEGLVQEPHMVRDFIVAFSASLDPRLWITLVEEELKELEEALSSKVQVDILKEMSDLMYVTLGFNMTSAGADQMGLVPKEEHQRYIDILNRAGDLHAQAIESFSGKPVNFYEAFRRVHMSNMSKLKSDGTPHKRADGKILKSENYRPAKLGDLV